MKAFILMLTGCMGFFFLLPNAVAATHKYLPRYIAHKAMISAEYIGNTREAVLAAVASPVDGMEVDIRCTQDGVPIVYHGLFLEEETNGTGLVSESTWEQVRSLKYLKSPTSSLISLENLFQLVGAQKFLLLEVKTDNLFSRGVARRIAGLVQEYQLQKTVIIESFSPVFLYHMRAVAPEIQLMYTFTTQSEAIGEESQQHFDQIAWIWKQPFIQNQIIRFIKPDVLGPRFNIATSRLVKMLAAGYPVIAWTVDDITQAQALFSLGVSGLESNRPLDLMTLKTVKI